MVLDVCLEREIWMSFIRLKKLVVEDVKMVEINLRVLLVQFRCDHIVASRTATISKRDCYVRTTSLDLVYWRQRYLFDDGTASSEPPSSTVRGFFKVVFTSM
ncbi:unnamed protein product [Microthlaspi erraticum]|uniref:Uncharacterized protein n=1 Tax=Microthlaspi erraticum TaxID=1685480 RepID=A0A6D2JD13_9BRAS|nr:unnamed protein product [Microthlaspi erraticum]